ncbi:MAG TPA: hypothetical protein VGO03_07565 [Acidimicrobiia bacterium]|jgi:glyoxylase-like metal-dependent hydrolase (beta-lactamase superfamily II)
MTIDRCRVGDIELIRVGYADVTVPADRVGLSAEQIRAVPWAEPLWAEGDDPRAGAAVWLIRTGDALIAVDPAQAADDILRDGPDADFHQEAFAALLADAGMPRESVTHAVMTHAEGIGMWAWRDDGAWTPFFPNAPLYASRAELDALDAGAHPSVQFATPPHPALDALRAQGVMRAVDSGDEIVPGVRVEVVGGHSPGHMALHIESGGDAAIMLGHLTVSPLHLATGECPQQHPDPASVERWLDGVRGENALLIGPLWPSPGSGRWLDGSFVATPATPAS